MDYSTAQFKLRTARNPAQGKQIANNTRLEPRGNAIAVKLHGTDVITFNADGSFTLDSGGWRTVTTKERMNRFAPIGVFSERGVWHVTYQGQTYLYADGITFYPDGKVTGYAPESEVAKDKETRKRVKAYASAFTDKLFAGEIHAPSNGDCWGCLMRATDGSHPMGGPDHIESHMEDSYYVPSLLVNALESAGASIAAEQTAYAFMQGKLEHAFTKDRKSFLASQIQNAIRKHCLRELGMSA